jgi:hypothetical protein
MNSVVDGLRRLTPALEIKELGLRGPAPNRNLRFLAPAAFVAAIAALAIPSGALAQDPSVDQYAPTAPSGGGKVLTAPGAPASDSGSESSAAPTTATTPTTTTGAPTDTGTTDNGDDSNSKTDQAERTLDEFANAHGSSPAAAIGSQPAADLLRTDSGSGMGAALWIVLGVTLLWAIATGVARFRGRKDGPTA